MSTHTTIAKTLDETIERLMDEGVDTDVLARMLMAHAIGLKIARGASEDDICDEVVQMIREAAQKLSEGE